MSTDHQRYSTANQRDALARYADQHDMEIVCIYADEGKSGLNLEGRRGLQELLRDVQGESPGFTAILVYDVTRWGRFQDADESAYYEYLCRRSGIDVVYCAEPFENDRSPMTVVLKSVKRAMAAEYSRELSAKVFAGQCRLIELGFRQGGPAGFGLRRTLVDEHRQPKGELHVGERKSLQCDRVVLTPGPAEEVAVVQQIFEWFVRARRSEQDIADSLNDLGIRTDLARLWTRGSVHQILVNEKYVGHNVYNRTSHKLRVKRVKNPREMWVRADQAFEPLVSPEIFALANERIADRSRPVDDAVMLSQLRDLYARTGVLSGILIDEQVGMPSSSAYRQRFGGLIRAYTLVGFQPCRDYEYLEINQALRSSLPNVVSAVLDGFMDAGGWARKDERTGMLVVNDEFSVSIVLARCLRTPAGMFRWRIRFDTSLRPDLTVVVRMASDQAQALDYYLFPRIDTPIQALRLAEEGNGPGLDAYRFDSLDCLYALATREPFGLAA
ncbi:recombinase family protein [Lysobacter gummosus]|uniref:recombinase family protein n=1 Tax=Lysobacter TaxID=68 RepID=UPI001F3D5850|nr:recombinase family protein [Lysobacter capsici]UJQ27062.1 recombinase family protein [Lysobacter gummosus]